MRPTARYLLAASALFALAACDSTPDLGEDGDGRSASGEVLEGSISDAMIATDSVKSQAPLLRELPASPASSEPGEEAAEDDVAQDAIPEPEPETGPAPTE